MELRKCTCCGRELPLDQFSKKTLGLSRICRECHGKKIKEARPEEGYLERCPEEEEVNNNCSLGFRPDCFECIAPTLQMAMKWLREVHHLYIQVMLDSWAYGGHMGYYVVIQNTTSDFGMMLQDALDDVFYDTYEEASEVAIKYCLENLI